MVSTRHSPRDQTAPTPTPKKGKAVVSSASASTSKVTSNKGKQKATPEKTSAGPSRKRRDRSPVPVQEEEEEEEEEDDDEEETTEGPSNSPVQTRRSSRRLSAPSTIKLLKKQGQVAKKSAKASPKPLAKASKSAATTPQQQHKHQQQQPQKQTKQRGRPPKQAEKDDVAVPKKKKTVKTLKIIYISDSESEDTEIEEEDSGDDFSEGDDFDPVEVAKSFVKPRKHIKGEDEDDDDEEEGDEEQNEDDEEGSESAPKRRKAKKEKEKKPKVAGPKGKSAKATANFAAMRKKNKEARESLPLPISVTSDSHTPDVSCCLLCSSREFNRVMENNDQDLLKACLQNPQVGHWYYGITPDNPLENPLSKAVANDLDELIHILMTPAPTTKNEDPPRAYLDPPGSTSHAGGAAGRYRTYGRALKKVNESRGNREGNNAFYNYLSSSPYDFDKRGTPVSGDRDSVSGVWNHALRAACRLPYSEKTFDRLALSCPNEVQCQFATWGLYEAVSAGNRKLGAKMLELMRDYAGSFNTLHSETLALDAGVAFTPFRAVSVLKKANRESHSVKPLHFAAINPDSEKLSALLDAISPVNQLDVDDLGRNVVHFAAVCEGTGPLKLVMERGFDIKTVDGSKMSPLLLAAKYGRDENVKIILEATGGNTQAADSTFLPSGYTALHFAAGLGHVNVVQTLLDAGATLDLIDKNGKLTPLMHACRTGQTEVVNLLLEKGADIFASDNMGRTPLIHAAKNGCFDIVVKLLAEGADADACDTSDNTVLHYACGYGWLDVVKALLEYGGATLNSLNSWKCSPLMIADAKGHFGVTQYLLEIPGIGVNFLDKNGFSMVHLTFKTTMSSKQDVERLLKKLEVLLKHGADPNLKSVDGDTALHLLMKWQFENGKFTAGEKSDCLKKGLEMLVENGALLEEEDRNGKTPLCVALSEQRLGLAVELIQAGAHIKNVKSSGQNFMHIVMNCLAVADGWKLKATRELDHNDCGKGFLKVADESKALAEEANLLLDLLKAQEHTAIIAAQLVETDSQGFSPLIRSLQKNIDDQVAGASQLESQCRNLQTWYWQEDDSNKKDKFLVNLDSSYALWVKGTQQFLKTVDSATVVNAVVEVPKNFKKSKPTDPNPVFTGYSLLHFAANACDDVLVKILIDLGADVNVQDDKGLTPLYIASTMTVSSNKLEDAKFYKFEQRNGAERQCSAVRALIAAGANPIINDKEGESVLYRTIRELPNEEKFDELPADRKEMVLALVESINKFDGSALNVLSKTDSKTCVMLALDKGYDKFVSAFFDCGASKDVVGPNNVSTALYAIRQGRVLATQLVLSADLTVADNTGETCAMAACAKSDEIANLVLDSNRLLNLGATNKKQETALLIAIKNSRSGEVIGKILNKGVDVNYADPNGKTSLIWAIESKKLEIVKLLIQHGANVNVQDKVSGLGQWAVHYAVLSRNNKIVLALLEAGARLDVTRVKDLASPLHIAVEKSKDELNKSLKIERSLLHFGASLNPIDAQGRTPLHIAFYGLGRVPVMDLTSHELKVRREYDEQLRTYNSAKEKVKSYVKQIIGANSDTEKAAVFEWFYGAKQALPENELKPVEDKRSTAEEYALGVMDTSRSSSKNDPVEIVDFLASLPNIKPDVVDKFGRTPLHYAALIGASSCTNALLKAGVDLDRADKDGNTPLQLSLLGEHVDFYLNLGLQGAKVNGHIRLANGTTESNFFYALMKGFMSIGYFIKNKDQQNLCIAISDSLRTGRYSLALSMASVASVSDLQAVDGRGRNLLHVLGDFKAINSSIWEEEYASEIFEALKKANLDVNALDQEGRTALICAAKNDQEVVLELLLTLPGVLLDVSDKSGAAAMLNATLSRSTRMIKALLEKGAAVDHSNTSQQISVLRAAVAFQSEEILDLVLRAGASVNNEEPDKKMTPLMKAIYFGNKDIVVKLVESGVDLDKLSPYRFTDEKGENIDLQVAPIVIAQSKPNIFKILVQAGANVDAKHPQTQRTSLMEAIDRKSTEMIELLLKHGADVNLVDPKHEQSSFQWGVLQSIAPFKDLSIDLSQFNPDVSVPNNKTGFTLLDHAITTANRDMVKKLLALGANPNTLSLPTANPENATSLMLAIQLNDLKTVELLFTESSTAVNTSAKDKNGRTVIHYAVRPYTNSPATYQNTEMIRYLHDKGCSVESVDSFGRRPIDYAAVAKNRILFDLLKDLDSPLPTAGSDDDEDEVMQDAPVIPLSNLEGDAILERARLEVVAEREEEEKMVKEAEKRGVDLSVVKTEWKKKEWIAVNPSANVDPAQVRVYYEGDGVDEYVPYNCVLHKCDVSRGMYGENKFYVMQVLYNHLQDLYFLFNKWGDSTILRTNGRSYDNGQFQKTPFPTKEACIAEFKKVFKSKTGNEWDAEEFASKPGKYVLIKTNKKRVIKVKPIDYKDVPESKLDSSVGEALRMFLQVASLKPSGSDSELALPFDGALDAGVVNKAYEILLEIRTKFKELDALMKDNTKIPSAKELLAKREELVILSTVYFRLLPTTETSQGLKPILSADLLSKEMIRANNLRYYDTSLMILLAASYNRTLQNPLDYTCAALQTALTPLTDAAEKQLLSTWIAQSKPANVEILNILKVDRAGESEAFLEEKGNKKLLFHGSKLSNMLGILKNGLQVAPIEAQATGYMFGKGIYFADVFAKSWGYVHDWTVPLGTSGDVKAYGYMFVCEVALGDSLELENSDWTLEAGNLRDGCSSTKGLGMREPHPDREMILPDNVTLPMGPLRTSPLRTDAETGKVVERCLSYNEFIVYDPAQVRIKYLLVLRDTSMCHLCLGQDSGMKELKEYGKRYAKYSDLPKIVPFEAEVATVVMQKRGISGQELWERDLEVKVVEGKRYLKRWQPSTRVECNTKVCKGCADVIMMDLMEEFCGENKELIVDELANREDCWHGRECKTQNHNSEHAQKLNHFCDKKEKVDGVAVVGEETGGDKDDDEESEAVMTDEDEDDDDEDDDGDEDDMDEE